MRDTILLHKSNALANIREKKSFIGSVDLHRNNKNMTTDILNKQSNNCTGLEQEYNISDKKNKWIKSEFIDK